MRRSSSLDRAADQLTDGAADAADLVVDVLSDVASSAVDAVAEGGEALAAVSASRFARTLKQPKSLIAILVLAILGAFIYRRFISGDDSMDDAIDDVPSLQR